MGKRLTAKAIEALEAKIAATGTESRSAVFGICGMDKQVLRCWSVVNGIPEPSGDGPTILIPERLEKLLWPKRRKIVWGGRGSAKTRTIISILTEFARMQTERVVCFREVMKSIADSSYQEVVDEINRKGHAEDFRVIEAKISVPANGSRFTFDGLLRNQTKIKGYAGATRAWVEEAETVSRTSWDILFPTLRAAGSEIWVSFNPREETDPTWSDLVAPHWPDAVDGIYEDDETLIIECNFEHNPWFTEELAMERDRMARTDQDRYAWIWLGQFRKRSDVKVLNGKWRVEEFTPHSGWDGPYFGADFGFARDASTLVKAWINDRTLYVEHEAYGAGIELDDMPAFYDKVPDSRRYTIYADSARPETISHIAKRGFKITGVEKWPGSVEDGITFLRSFDSIVIHPRCKHMIHEANAYEYKTDRLTGDILPDVVDKENHCIAEGELIVTSRGEIPVERVSVGDYVMTRKGWREVLDAWVSGENMPVVKIETDLGSLVCTPCHKVYVQGKGFVRADAIEYNDCVLYMEQSECQKHLSTKDVFFGAIRKVKDALIGFISKDR